MSGHEDSLRDGIHERLITAALDAKLRRLGSEGRRAERDPVEVAEAPAVLAQYLCELVRRRLNGLPEADRALRQVALANQILSLLRATEDDEIASDDDLLVEGPERLLEILAPTTDLGSAVSTPRPAIPFGTTDVLLGDRGEISIGQVILQEIPSAPRIDLVCSFLKWSGYRLLRDAIRAHLRDRAGKLRVLTTTYVGVTERRVLDDLRELGADVGVSYEHQRTRLHAKAWIFHRPDGLSTALVGSSNLSQSALLDGLEWNVRLSERVTPDVLRKLASTFEAYWDGKEFEAYDSQRDREKFDRAIDSSRGQGGSALRLLLELRPYSFQQEMLDRVNTERLIHNRHRNLIVAATGTGKTIVAALDFARLRREHPDWRLLFVAHRREILEQARDTYRHALGDVNFGDLLAEGEEPGPRSSVFAMIQSLHAGRLRSVDRSAYQVVVVDEFHHAEADTYRELLDHVRPQELLGLTATPERADGVRVQDEFFDGRIAAELRLWDALDRGLLVPFHYFGVADGTDLRGLRWSGGYQPSDLGNIYTSNEVRLQAVLRAIRDFVPDDGRMRALGFCAGVAHARWMAERFRDHDLNAVALSAESSPEERQQAIAEFRATGGGLRAIFTADLFNEGVDLPETDVLLLLRPTDSHVLFQQQLGRGLRRADRAGKSCLTVLDFIGQHHRRFRMHRRLAAVCGVQGRDEVLRSVEADFPGLPSGSAIHLERQAREAILESLRQATGSDIRRLEADLRELGPSTTLPEFLAQTGTDLADVYRSHRSWSELRRRAGFETRPRSSAEERLVSGLGRLLHIDDALRLRWLSTVSEQVRVVAESDVDHNRYWQMLEVLLTGEASGGANGVEDVRAALGESVVLRDEIRELSHVLLDRIERPTFPIDELPGLPLRVHATYRAREALAALGQAERSRIDQGVFHLPDLRADVFFVTLVKTTKEYSPTTLYLDYALSPELFHWQSQSTTSDTSQTGRRYIEHRERGHHILVFVRSRKASGGITEPYTLLGLADHVSHEGSRPISIVWKLRHAMPAVVYRAAAMVRATA